MASTVHYIKLCIFPLNITLSMILLKPLYEPRFEFVQHYLQFQRLKHREFLLAWAISITWVFQNLLVVWVTFIHWWRRNIKTAAPYLHLQTEETICLYVHKDMKGIQENNRPTYAWCLLKINYSQYVPIQNCVKLLFGIFNIC